MQIYSIKKRLGFILAILCMLGLLFGSISIMAQDEPPSQDDETPSFDALLSEVEGSSGEGPFGILIDTPREVDSTEIELNEVSLETLGGTVILWRGVALGDLDTLQQQAEEGADLTVRRRPETWSLAVSQGIVKVRIVDPELLQDIGGSSLEGQIFAKPIPSTILQQSGGGGGDFPAMVVVAGAQLNFDREKIEQGLNPFEIVPLDTSNADVNNILTLVVSDDAIPLQLSPQQILDLIDSQVLLNAVDDLSQASLVVNAILGTNIPQLNGVNSNQVDTTLVQTSVIEVILTQTNLTPEQLGELAANDPATASVLMNSITFGTGGIDALIELTAQFPNMIDLFVGLISHDPRAVDMMIQVMAESPSLLDEFNTRASNSPELVNLVIDRLSTNPGATMLLNNLATTSTNIIGALLDLAALTPDGSGAILLTNTILSSTEASQLFTETLLNNPELMEQFNQILANNPDTITSLVDGLASNPALPNGTVLVNNIENPSEPSNPVAEQSTFLCHIDSGSGDALVLGLSESELSGHFGHENDFIVGTASDRDNCLDIASEESDLPENWCSPGGIWDDGRCDDPDPDVQAYLWNLGWYSAALERGEIDSMPAEFATPPPPTAEPQVAASGGSGSSVPSGGCEYPDWYYDFNGGYFLATGATAYSDAACTVAGAVSAVDLVFAPAGYDALTLCNLNGVYTSASLVANDVYICNP